MLNSLLTKCAHEYLGAAPWKQRLDLFMSMGISVLPGCFVRMAGGGVLLTIAVCLAFSVPVLAFAHLVRVRMREIVRSNPDLAGTWVMPNDPSTLD